MNVEIVKQKGYNFLWINNELWMWDIPREITDQKEIADKAYGNVLVAGYGLGVVQKLLLENEKVKNVVTIEIHEQVIEECERVYNEIHGEIIFGDFYNITPRVHYDCVIGDIWLEYTSDGELREYLKFKERAKVYLKPGGKILAWGQDYFEYLLQRSTK